MADLHVNAQSGYKVDLFGRVARLMKRLTINGIVQLLKLAAERGLNPDDLLADTGIRQRMLIDPYCSIRPEQEFQVLRALLQRINDDAFGLDVGAGFRLSVLGVLGAAVPNAATVQDAIQFFIRFIALSYTYFEVRYELTAQGADIRLRDKIELGHLRRFFIDRDVMFTLTALHDIFPRSQVLSGIRIRLGYEAPDDHAIYAERIRYPLEFAEGDTVISLAGSLLTLALPQSNELTLKIMEQQCLSVAVRMTEQESTRERVTQILLTGLSYPAPLERVAQQLKLSTRTVRRRLQQEGIHFQHLLNELKQAEASRLLVETRWSVDRIAEVSGYSEAASFIHAFKRWTGMTPSAFRKTFGHGKIALEIALAETRADSSGPSVVPKG